MVTGQTEGPIVQHGVGRRGVIPAGTRQVRIMSHPGDRALRGRDLTVTVDDSIRSVVRFDGRTWAVDGRGMYLVGGDAGHLLGDVEVVSLDGAVTVWCDGDLDWFDSGGCQVSVPLLGPDGLLYRRCWEVTRDTVLACEVWIPEEGSMFKASEPVAGHVVPVRADVVVKDGLADPATLRRDRYRDRMVLVRLDARLGEVNPVLFGQMPVPVVLDEDLWPVVSDPVRLLERTLDARMGERSALLVEHGGLLRRFIADPVGTDGSRVARVASQVQELTDLVGQIRHRLVVMRP